MIALPRFMPKRAPEPDIPGVIPAWLPRSANACAWLLIIGQIYVLGLWVLDIARDEATPLMLGNVGFWALGLKFFFPVIIGFLAPAVGLPWLTKIGIPIYCELSYKRAGEGWPKAWMGVLIGLASLVLCSSGLVVYNGSRLEKNREGAVKVEQQDQGRAALQANLDAINQDLADITNPALTTYQAQSAREGAASWAKRVATAKAQKDYQADAIERALASAERGDQLRSDRKAAILALAAAPTKAAVVARVVEQGDQVTGIVDVVNQWRALFLAMVQDLAALLLGWIAYRLMRVRSQQLAAYEAGQPKEEIPGDALTITDQTDSAQPMPQESIWEEDPVTGELVEKIRMRRRKEEWFVTKTPRKARAKKPDPREAMAGPEMVVGLTEPEQSSGEAQEADDVGREINSHDQRGASDVASGGREWESGDPMEGSSGFGDMEESAFDPLRMEGEEKATSENEEIADQKYASTAESLLDAQEDQQAVVEGAATILADEDDGSASADNGDRQLADETMDDGAPVDLPDADALEHAEDVFEMEEGGADLTEPREYTQEELDELYPAPRGLPAPAETAE